jgi:hypothetical protein
MSNTGQPDPNKPAVPESLTQADDWLANAPLGDTELSNIFGPNPDAVPAAAQQPEAPAEQPQQEEFFLRGKKSVYKTPEEAVKGIDQKDELIDQLRQQYAQVTGIDPITGRPVGAPRPAVQQPPQVPSQVEEDYLANPSKFIQDLNAAIERGDGERFVQAHQRFVQSVVRPYVTVLQDVARTAAMERVRARIKDFDEFAQRELPSILQENPTLAQLIRAAEQTPELYQHLPDLYETAYYASRGKRLPELVKQQQQPTQPASPPPRPTLRPGTMPPVQATTSRGEVFDPNNPDENLADPEKRKAYMRWLETRGINDVKI